MVVLTLVIVVGTAVALTAAYAPPRPPAPLAVPADPLRPDLGMAPLTSLLVGESRTSAEVFLRFSATIVNVGAGPLRLAAHRAAPWSSSWDVWQQIDDRTGGYSERPTGATLVFGGDGHEHWHMVQAEAHQLETLDGSVVARLVKTGFCFFDNVAHAPDLPSAPAAAVHTAGECGGGLDRSVTMGLSVGWGDEYQWYLLDQTIEIGSIPDGRYRLRAIADPGDLIEELDETNNDTWTIIDLVTRDGHRRVEVIEQGDAS